MRRLVLLILVGLSALVGFATAQFCEIIYDGGVRKSMCSLLLELDSTSFSSIKSRLPQSNMNTALWRNYIGCWKIKNDSLFLDSILISEGYNKYSPIIIDDIFAKNRTASGYFANWVSDSLRVVSGEIVYYIHSGWESKWENEQLIAVERGIVKRQVCNNNRVVNKGIDESAFKSLLDSLELGEIPVRMDLQVNYSDFDSEGTPTSCRIKVYKGSGDAATDNRVVTAIERLLLSSKPLPIYLIDGKFISYPYTIPIRPVPKHNK